MSTLKALIGLAFVVGAAYIAFQFIPPYFANYQLRDSIQEIAKFAPVALNKTDEDVRNDVLKKAKEYEIPITGEQIIVTREDRNNMTIKVDYTRTVELIGGKRVVLEFHDSSK